MELLTRCNGIKDSTLIKTKSGNVFPKSAEDWKWWDGSVEKRLKSLDSEGFVQNECKVLVEAKADNHPAIK